MARSDGNRIALVATLALLGACRARPTDAEIATCSAAHVAGSAAMEALWRARARGEAMGLPLEASVIARACAPLYKEPACRRAHERFDEEPLEHRAGAVLEACQKAYCPILAPRPAACDKPADIFADNVPFWEAVTRHDLGGRAERVLEVQRAGAARVRHAQVAYFDAGAAWFSTDGGALRTKACVPGADDAGPEVMRIVVRGGAILLDGEELAKTAPIAEGNRVQRIEPLLFALKERRTTACGKTAATLAVQADVPVVVVKSVFETAAFAGYPDIRVERAPPAAAP